MRYYKNTSRRGRKSVKSYKKAKAVKRVKSSPVLKKAVAQILSAKVETKEAYHNSGNTLTFFNSGINAIGDMMQIVPSITTGTGDNTRNGSQLLAKSLNIRGYIKLQPGDTLDQTTLPSVVARLMVVTYKPRPSYIEATASASGLNGLLRKGGTISAFTGLLSDIHAPINTDLWTVHADKRFYLNQSFLNGLGAAVPSNSVAQDIRNTVKFFNINVKCRNRVLKYDATSGSDLYPTNFGPMLLLGYSYLDGSSPDTVSTQLGLQYITTLKFEDM